MSQKIILLCLLLLPACLFAQQQRFKAGLIAGANAAQLNGDNAAGFNKLGISAGLRGIIILKPKMEISIDMLFSQRGSRPTSSESTPFNIQLNYIEVPIAFNYMDWLSEGEDYYKLHFHAGLSYSRLISQSIEDDFSGLESLGPFIRQNDLAYLLGVTFFTGPKLGFMFRYTRSFIPVFKRTDNTPNSNSLLSYHISLHAIYLF